MRYKLRIEFRLTNLFDIDVHRHFHYLANCLAKALYVFTFFTDHDARAGCVNRNACRLCRTLNLNPANRCLRQLLPDVLANVQVFMKFCHIGGASRIPDRGMVFDDA
jgi:hypothetical protein